MPAIRPILLEEMQASLEKLAAEANRLSEKDPQNPKSQALQKLVADLRGALARLAQVAPKAAGAPIELSLLRQDVRLRMIGLAKNCDVEIGWRDRPRIEGFTDEDLAQYESEVAND